jgi:hypothetical protein
LNKTVQGIKTFIGDTRIFKGDDEAQVFCDRLIQAFGHKGYKEHVPLWKSACATKKKAQGAQILSEPITGDGFG